MLNWDCGRAILLSENICFELSVLVLCSVPSCPIQKSHELSLMVKFLLIMFMIWKAEQCLEAEERLSSPGPRHSTQSF